MRLPTKRRLATVAALPISAVAVAGCADKFTGGGTIPSTDQVPTDQANFGFTYKITDTSTGTGQTRGAYHDVYAPDYPLGGVELRFDGLLMGDTAPGSPCVNNGIEGIVNYVSQNSNYAGSGQAFLKACDNGQPGVTNDLIGIDVLTGPYAGYENSGFLTGGNLRAH